MKKVVMFTMLFVIMTAGICSADTESAAKDGMLAYSGTNAFTRLTAEERQECMSWLVNGGVMNDICSGAVMKMVSESPNAVTLDQRQALITVASSKNTSTPSTASAPAPVQSDSNQSTVKKSDDTGKLVAIGLLGILAGMVIHNNRPKHHHAAPVYHPIAPKPAPVRYVPQAPQRMPSPPNMRMPDRRPLPRRK